MVEIMRAPSLGPNMAGSMDVMEVASRFSDVKLAPIHETEVATTQDSRKDSAREVPKSAYRSQRRAFSSNDYQLPSPSAFSLPKWNGSPSGMARSSNATSYFPSQSLKSVTSVSPLPSTPSTPSEYSLQREPSPSTLHQQTHRQNSIQLPGPMVQGLGSLLRPALHSPRRSYSVMDHEPVPVLQRPGEKLKLIHLPAELHFAIFDFLDPIDSTCLGLTSKHFYAIHWRMHGTVPLSARREGPNDMEWAWRLAGPLIASGTSKENALAMVLPRGQVYCRKCGISRCELHRHITEWVGKGYEYCEVRQKFGPPATEDARKKCYRSSPRHPHRCGRHVIRQRAVRLV